MKAHKYKPHKVTRPGYLQPKLNGLRAVWNGKELNTYNMEVWDPCVLPHITKAIKDAGLEHLHLDGEIYIHGKSLQYINSRASVNRTQPHKEYYEVEFHVFDVVLPYSFKFRNELLTREFFNVNPQSPLKLCDTYTFSSEHEENVVFNLCRKLGYEGMIYRDGTEVYGLLADCGNKANRWWKIMKRKFWEDMDAEILECVEGQGKFAGSLGSFRCRGENGSEFNVGTGEALTHEMRDAYWRRDMVGTTIKVKYEMLSDSGIPLKPVVEAVYE